MTGEMTDAITGVPGPGELRAHFTLDPRVTFLNHGSFGACPRAVQAAQARWRERMEREPVTFLARELEGRLDEARAQLARFVGAAPSDLAFVPNATFAVSSVARSLVLAPGDELLATDHGYNACRNAIEHVAERAGARVVTARLPFPIADAEQAVRPILDAVTPRTRLALLDHVTSPTALVLPMARLVAALERRGVDVLVDGAHAPGMLPLALSDLGAAYYTGNCHKWLCAPKGAAFLYVRPDRQARVTPAVVSHGRNDPRADRSRFLLEFGWLGTSDPTAYLTVPDAIAELERLVPGGWPEAQARNHALALFAQATLARALEQPAPAPPEMVGARAAVAIPEARARGRTAQGLQEWLFQEHAIETHVAPWPTAVGRVLRVSAQLYNHADEYERLAQVLMV
jgi:isopenicillin-N epimerase